MRLLFLAGLAFAACSPESPAPSMDLSTQADLTAGNVDLGGPSWTTFGQQFFQSYCVSCHKPGGQAAQQDFNQYAVVKANAAIIRCGTAPAGMLPSGCSGTPSAGQFPVGTGPMPTDAERNSLVTWI